MTLKNKYKLWLNYYFPTKSSTGFNSQLNRHFKLLKPLWNSEVSEINLLNFYDYCDSNFIEPDTLELSRLLLKAIIEWNSDNINSHPYRGNYTLHSNSSLAHIPPLELDSNNLNINSTLEEVYSIWMNYYKNTISYRNLKRLELAWKTIKELHQYPFRLLRQTDIMPFKSICSKECYEMIYSLLARLDWLAYSADITDKQHFHRIKRDFYNPAQRHYLTELEVQVLIDNRNSHLIDIILVMIYTGMTLHEMMELDISWIDLNSNTITVHHITTPYTRLKDRIIPIHPRIRVIMEAWTALGKPWFYVNSKKYFTTSFYLRNYCRLVGLALLHHEFLLQDLRYTFQINLESTTATTTQVACLLGNKLRSVGGRVYTHPSVNKLTQIINELS